MGIEAQPGNQFESAREKFEQIVAHLENGAAQELGKTEEWIHHEGLELQRQLLQARLDVLFERERAALAANPPAAGMKKRIRRRQVESQFGRVQERRHGLKEDGVASRFPLDEQLNVPAGLYSYPLRRRVAEEVATGSFDHALERIEQTTAGHVPKRQAEELVVRLTSDVAAFYAERECAEAANDTLQDPLLLLSSDGCSIRMVRSGLRDATRQAAEKADLEAEAVRGDPTAAPPRKRHQTRRAMVTAVWDQERHDRTANDVIANLQRDPHDEKGRQQARGPRPQHKRLTASIERNLGDQISELFDEADRRDPERTRETVVLVDGDEHQSEAVKEQGCRRGRPLTIVLDLLHAMHYLWIAANAIAGAGGHSPQATELVTRWTIQLLTGDPAHLIATIRGAATRRQLGGKARKAVDGAADYLLKRTPHINYASFIARGLPIASGVIEGACRHIVRDRLDITGARWSVQVAEAVLKLRALRASGDWDDYWMFHQANERARNYPKAA